VAKNNIIGSSLRPNVGIAEEYAKPIKKALEQLKNELDRELKRAFRQNMAMDASITSQTRIILNALLDKWQPIFNDIAKRATKKMIARTVTNSAITLKKSLKGALPDLSIDTSFSDERLEEVIKASTLEAANLIKTIPYKYLNEVQGQVMRSITTGKGLADLVPYLTKMYKGNVRKANLVALDQTRKAYQSINTSRLKSIGVKKFVWIHSGGGKEPRELHVKMSGNEYSFDDPPFIGRMYGQDIYGFPAELPNCRCICKPVLNFTED
jgi:SPP1 gp7 family putative phage head morphogenesis protein